MSLDFVIPDTERVVILQSGVTCKTVVLMLAGDVLPLPLNSSMRNQTKLQILLSYAAHSSTRCLFRFREENFPDCGDVTQKYVHALEVEMEVVEDSVRFG